MEPKHRTRRDGDDSRRSAAGELREVLKSRSVVALLVVTAAASAVGTAAEVQRANGPELAVLEPAAASMVERADGEPEPIERAWAKLSAEEEADRLVRQYAGQGYDVDAELAREIANAAMRHDIDVELAFGLVRAESGFRNSATSPVGAVGLTQLMPKTAAWMQPGISRSALRNPETNLNIGFKYLRYLLDKYEGNEDLALLAYNRGPGTVDRALKRGRNPDNGYAAFVRGKKNHGHKLFSE